jgi:uridylate kinase
LTATILGAALRAEEVQTWKDVDGILTTDPRIVKTARTVPVATYDEVASSPISARRFFIRARCSPASRPARRCALRIPIISTRRVPSS